MPLPEIGPKEPWPPNKERATLAVIREWGAWWSGDPTKLMEVYGGAPGALPVGQAPARKWWRFWDRSSKSDSSHGGQRQRAQLHIPLAGDIASTSAALLFSEPPVIQIPEAHAKNASTDAKAAEDELQRIRTEGGLDQRLLEAADYAAGLGGVYVKPAWDTALADHPLLAIVQPDQAIPEFQYGILTGATLWRIVDQERDVYLRHLERHETDEDGGGVVLHALYRGDRDRLGERQPDDQLKAKTGLDPFVQLPFRGLGIHYVANKRPNRRMRGSPLGESDYAGAEGMLDALDESWASWIRDIRLAKARIVVPQNMLDRGGGFDLDHEIFTELASPGDTAEKGLSANVSLLQAAIRVDEHSRTCLGLIERIVDHGGYAIQTFGLGLEGNAQSGTALRIRERKSFLTQQRKGASYGAVIASCGEQMLAIAREVFDRQVSVFRPRVELSDSIADDDRQVAETVELWTRAKAASIELRVRTLHPDWEDSEVGEEVLRIKAEEGLVVAPPEAAA